MTWKVKKFNELTINELYTILKERVNIFVVEQNCPYPEIDDQDQHAYHLYKEVDGEIVAYSRIFPKNIIYAEASIGRIIVNKEYRGKEYGKELLEKSIQFLETELNEEVIKIHAQHYLFDFYQSFGFEPVTEVYLEDNIPHVDMIRK